MKPPDKRVTGSKRVNVKLCRACKSIPGDNGVVGCAVCVTKNLSARDCKHCGVALQNGEYRTGKPEIVSDRREFWCKDGVACTARKVAETEREDALLGRILGDADFGRTTCEHGVVMDFPYTQTCAACTLKYANSKLSRCVNHNKAECPSCGTHFHIGNGGDPCEVSPVSSAVCRYGTRSCNAQHVCETCGSVNDAYCCEDSPGYDTTEYWEEQGRRLAKHPEMRTHPETNHECRVCPPDGTLFPKTFTVEVYSGDRCRPNDKVVMDDLAAGREPTRCQRNELGCLAEHKPEDQDVWYAELSGIIEYPDGTKSLWAQLTDGKTPVLAMYMAYDLVACLKDECVNKGDPTTGTPNRAHCYCRETTLFYKHPDDTDVTPAIQCCLCDQQTPLSWLTPKQSP